MSSPYPCPRIEWVSVNGQRVDQNGGGILITKQIQNPEEGEKPVKVDLSIDIMVNNPCGPGYIYARAIIAGKEGEFDTYSIGGDENDMPIQLSQVELRPAGQNEMRIEVGWIDPINDTHYKTDEWTVYVNVVLVGPPTPPPNPPPYPVPPTPPTPPPGQQPPNWQDILRQLQEWLAAQQMLQYAPWILIGAAGAGILVRLVRSK